MSMYIGQRRGIRFSSVHGVSIDFLGGNKALLYKTQYKIARVSRDGWAKKVHQQESVIINRQDASYIQLLFKQQYFHEKACRDAHLVCYYYSCNFLVAFYTCLVYFLSEQSINTTYIYIYIYIYTGILIALTIQDQQRCCGLWPSVWVWSVSEAARPRQHQQAQNTNATVSHRSLRLQLVICELRPMG